MLGYVVTDKPELKIKDFEAYRGYYCGICKSVGKRYGQLPRFGLSYDFAFLAVLLDSLREEKTIVEMQHCIIHPVKKIPIVLDNEILDYSADVMVLLIYYNLLDDKMDDHRIRGTLGSIAFRRMALRVKKKYPIMAQTIEEKLSLLTTLEKAKTSSIDITGDAFADIMAEVFAGEGLGNLIEESQIRPLRHLGRNLGRFIYVMDALSDIEEDIKSGSYNPIIYRFKYEASESVVEFRNRIKSSVQVVLMSCLTEIESAYSLLDIKKNRGILDNIIYFGLLKKTENELMKGTEQHEKSI